MWQQIASVKKRILILGIEWFEKQPYDFAYDSERFFKPELPLPLVKVLLSSFEQCFGSFMMLLLEGSSEMGHFRHFSNHGFPSA